MRTRTALLLLFAFSLAAALLVAQTVETQEPEGAETAAEGDFSEVVEVEVIEVNVQVTDKKGRPVSGLSVGDFEVFEDGQRVEVTNFRAIEGVAPEPSDSPRAPRGSAPSLPLAEVREQAGEPTGLAPPPHVIFFVDNVNIRPMHRTRVMKELRRFIVDMQLPARMMVASYDQSLKIRQRFTTEVRTVLEALDEVEERPPFGETAHDDFRELVREIEDRYSRQAWLENRVQGYAEEIRLQVRKSLEAMRELLDTLAGLEGRKALVYVSDGLPLTPAEELFNALELRFHDMTVLHKSLQYNQSRDFESLAQVANTAGVTFYTLHAAGLEAPMSSDAEVAGSGLDELRITVDSVRLANTQGSGRLLAAETGGLAFLNQNSFEDGLGLMVEDLSHFYSLGYRSRHGGDGRYHKIEVRTKDKKLKLRHRQGYRDRSRSQRMGDLVASTVQYGFSRNPLAVSITVGAGDREQLEGDQATSVVPVRVGIPLANVVLIPRGAEHRGRIRLFVAVQDQDGATSPTQEIAVPIAIPDDALERALETSWVQKIQLRMRPGPHLLVVGLWDEIGLESSITSQRVMIGS